MLIAQTPRMRIPPEIFHPLEETDFGLDNWEILCFLKLTDSSKYFLTLQIYQKHFFFFQKHTDTLLLVSHTAA